MWCAYRTEVFGWFISSLFVAQLGILHVFYQDFFVQTYLIPRASSPSLLHNHVSLLLSLLIYCITFNMCEYMGCHHPWAYNDVSWNMVNSIKYPVHSLWNIWSVRGSPFGPPVAHNVE